MDKYICDIHGDEDEVKHVLYVDFLAFCHSSEEKGAVLPPFGESRNGEQSARTMQFLGLGGTGSTMILMSCRRSLRVPSTNSNVPIARFNLNNLI